MKAVIVLMLFLFNLPLHTAEYNKNELKSAYIYKFSNFIHFPEKERSSFNISVVKDLDLFNYISESFKDKTLEGLPVHVTFSKSMHPGMLESDIIIMDSINSEETKSLSSFSGLIITEESSLKDPAIINFIQDKNKLHFQINQSRAENLKIKISSRLLNLARLVQ